MSDLVGLADANNFFYSCECVSNPRLLAKPVVILSSNDGCVVARSEEAKALGVAMGEAIFKRRAWFRHNKIITLSGNLSLYSMFSARIFSMLENLVPSIEFYSIDEAFFTPAPSWNEGYDIWADRTVRHILQSLGIPLTIGIAPTRTLAKIAVRCAKRQHRRQWVLETPRQIADILDITPIEDVWGIGRKRAAHYRYHGIQSAADLAAAPAEAIRRYCGLMGLRTYYELRGQACHNTTPDDTPIKSCLVSRSFGRPVEHMADLQQAIAYFTNKLAYKLRRANVLALRIAVFLNTSRFHDNYFAPRGEIAITPSNDTAQLNAATGQVLRDIFRPHHRYRRAGVACAEVIPLHASSVSLFDDQVTTRRRERLWQAIDELNQRYGMTTLVCGHRSDQPIWMPRKQHTNTKSQHSERLLEA